MDDKEIEEIRKGFIGVWDFIGRYGPKMFDEVAALRQQLAECRNSLEVESKCTVYYREKSEHAETERDKWKDRAEGWAKNHQEELEKRVQAEAALEEARRHLNLERESVARNLALLALV